MLSDAELLRYSRHVLLADIDIAGQERLRAARVLVAGLGGLGCPAALYLAAAGVGHLVLADGDAVELSNLQRQIAHTEARIGLNKAQSAAAAVRALNSGTRVTAVPQHLNETRASEHLAAVDLVIDATDNYAARYLLNRACIAHGLPLVSAAAVRLEGQLSVFHPAAGGPCYRCLYPNESATGQDSCSESGVLGPLVGVLGALQALEALKLLTGLGEPLRGRLLVLDAMSLDIRQLTLAPRPDCPDCGSA